MALRRIVGVSRNGRGNIEAVCVADLDGQLTVGTVIDDINSARHRYVVEGGGRPTRVFVVRDRGSGRAFLRTGPDRDTANNLDGLPSCDDLPATLTAPVRRDVATVDDDERARLRDAILQLNRRFLSPEDQVSIWFKQDQIHQATHVHGNTYQASFLAWHRLLINEFERQLQQIDPTLALHYWDWTTDPRRAPDGRGGTVNLMTPDFMGASDGPIGTPYLEASFYSPTSPNREQPGSAAAPPAPALPPREVSRQVQSDTPLDVAGFQSDEEIVSAGLDPRPGIQFEKLWRAIYANHTLAHLYIGGNIGGFDSGDVGHRSFEDPFVFLLHSNVDRLWASWQLNQRSFNAWEEPAWRVEPMWSYGQLIDDRLDETALEVSPPETQAEYDARYKAAVQRDGILAGRDIKSTMAPWNGLGSSRMDPWAHPGADLPLRPIDRAILRPPLYDRYTFEDNLCAAWATLLGGKRLSTHDVVQLSVELDVVARDQVEFVLRSGSDVSWWKALELPDRTMIETDGANEMARALHPVDLLAGGELLFHKLQGVIFPGRGIVFRVADLGWIQPGSRLTFRWEDD